MRHARCILLLALLTLLWRGFFAVEPPGRDQGIFLTQADLWLDGARLYQDVWEHKPPGIIWLYAGALASFGRDYLSIHILNALAGFLTALGLWLLTRGWGFASLSAGVAAVAYLLIYSGPAFGGFWDLAQTEVLMDPFLIFALLLIEGRSSQRERLRHASAGLLIGCALLLKYSALPLVLLGAWPLLRRELSWRRRLALGGAFGMGLAACASAILIGFSASGGLGPMWEATVLFNLANSGAFVPTTSVGFLQKVFYHAAIFWPAYLTALLTWPIWRVTRNPLLARPPIKLALGLWILSLLQVFWQGKFWIYHYHVVLLPLSLLLACGFENAGRIWTSRLLVAQRRVVLTGLLLLSALPASLGLADYVKNHELIERWTGAISERDFERSYRWGGDDYDYSETRAVAERLREETRPDERIFQWGWETGLYFFARRPPASRYLYDLPFLPRFGAMRDLFTRRLMQDLEAHPPARFIVLTHDANDIEPEDSASQLEAFEPLRNFLRHGYRLAWRLGDFLCYAPGPDAENPNDDKPSTEARDLN